MSSVVIAVAGDGYDGGGRILADGDGKRYVVDGTLQRTEPLFRGRVIIDRGAASAARYLYVVGFPVPPEDEEEFDRWYSTEHLDLLSKHRSWRRCRVFAGHGEGESELTRLAFHDWLDTSPQGSPEQAAARATPWRARLAERPWFAQAQRLLLHDADDQRTEISNG
jgi:hypothetical protein